MPELSIDVKLLARFSFIPWKKYHVGSSLLDSSRIFDIIKRIKGKYKKDMIKYEIDTLKLH